MMKRWLPCLLGMVMAGMAMPAFAGEAGLAVAGIPLEFIFFAVTLLCVAVFHNQTFYVALSGLVVIATYKLLTTGFKTGPGIEGLIGHVAHEWVILVNLFCLLMGFSILARHLEKSHVPVRLPKYLPHDWKGGFVLLALVFVISGFLDNIAAAMIGGAMAHQLFQARVHIGYLAAIVAASNAGGAGSVVGDTTTTMMWISGIGPGEVFHAYVAAAVALLIVGYFAAKQQHAYSPIIKHAHKHTHIEWHRIGIVALILSSAVGTNVLVNMIDSEIGEQIPAIGLAVWVPILLSSGVMRHDWEVLGANLKGTLFLLALVLCASLMPVEELPAPSWQSAFGLGFISAVFDNIPLTALAITQGGYDWGFLAFAVGFGGSMVWFGSSAGVALSNMYPEAKSVGLWLRHGWYVPAAYVAGFMVMLGVLGWQAG